MKKINDKIPTTTDELCKQNVKLNILLNLFVDNYCDLHGVRACIRFLKESDIDDETIVSDLGFLQVEVDSVNKEMEEDEHELS